MASFRPFGWIHRHARNNPQARQGIVIDRQRL
jgi:hypothetical protein